jgi:hypothetical protein
MLSSYFSLIKCILLYSSIALSPIVIGLPLNGKFIFSNGYLYYPAYTTLNAYEFYTLNPNGSLILFLLSKKPFYENSWAFSLRTIPDPTPLTPL